MPLSTSAFWTYLIRYDRIDIDDNSKLLEIEWEICEN